MTTHPDVLAALDQLRAKATKVERNAHLGQPIRSSHVYADLLAALQPTAPDFDAADHSPDRYGLAALCARVAWGSKHQVIDRDATVRTCDHLAAQLEDLTQRMRATR